MKYQKYLNQFKKIIRQDLKQEVIKGYLFGSFARGEHKKDSNIDILLVVNNKKKIADKVGDFVIDTLIDKGPYFSVKIFDQKKFNQLHQKQTFFIQHFQQDVKIL